jgi:hypothetical protein
VAVQIKIDDLGAGSVQIGNPLQAINYFTTFFYCPFTRQVYLISMVLSIRQYLFNPHHKILTPLLCLRSFWPLEFGTLADINRGITFALSIQAKTRIYKRLLQENNICLVTMAGTAILIKNWLGRKQVDQHIEVMHKSLSLAEIMLEAIEYLQQKTREGCFEEMVEIFVSLVIAFQEINQAIQPALSQLEKDQLEEAVLDLFDAFEMVSSVFKKGSQSGALESVENALVPCFKQWHLALRHCLGKYTLS